MQLQNVQQFASQKKAKIQLSLNKTKILKQFIFLSLILFLLCSLNYFFTEEKQYLDTEVQPAIRILTEQNQQETKDFLHIHLIPHSHDDVGWVKTVDQYFQTVNTIINSVLNELLKNSTRTFVQVETAFLHQWWNHNSEERRNLMKQVVKNGQIEFLNGGWVSHDEATPYYEDIIDQMTVGHQWLLETFDQIPTNGWQVDPFGHSSTNAALFHQMGFNGWWFSRVDYQDKQQRLKDSSLEMIWSPFQASGESNAIYSAVNYNHYNPPKGFNFDAFFRDPGIDDVPSSYGYNLIQKCDSFANHFRSMSTHFKSKHLLQTMGEDFTYSQANLWYDNIDKLMNHINANPSTYKMKMLYSTPSNFLSEINKLNITFPLNKDDFFPYADTPTAYWTGYFTSRVSFKGNVRESGRYLQHIRNIFSIFQIQGTNEYLKSNQKTFLNNLKLFEQEIGVLQHHDAVSGTEKQYVANDYIQRLENSKSNLNSFLHSMLEEATLKDLGENVTYSQCRWNETASHCSVVFNSLQNKEQVLLKIYNPSVSRNMTVKVKIPKVDLQIINSQNNIVYGEAFCLNQDDTNDCDLYFESYFEGYSSKYFKLAASTDQDESIKYIEQKQFANQVKTVTVVEGVYFSFFNLSSRYSLKTCENDLKTCQEQPFSIKYNYYQSSVEWQSSGAYIFRSDQDNGSYLFQTTESQEIYNGKLLTILLIKGNNIQTQVKVYANKEMRNVIELETFVKQIQQSKEVVLIVDTYLNNNKTFFTDSNGLELQKRVLNYRPTWNLEVQQKISGNYYPVNGFISLYDIDSLKRVSIVNDRSQGGTSLKEGQLELMIHRRLSRDDARGVDEALNELDNDHNYQQGLKQKLRHFITFEKQGSTDLARKIQIHLDSLPILFFSHLNLTSFPNSVESQSTNSSLIFKNSDPYLKIYLRPFGEDYLMRLNNLNDKKPINFFLPKEFSIIEEVTLTANQSKQSWNEKRFNWQTERQENKNVNSPSKDYSLQDNFITVKPLELKAFKIRKIKNEIDT